MNGSSEERGTRQISALTGVRGVAALWVAAFHGSLAWGVAMPALFGNVIHGGWLAVDLFFVLSGFVISHAHARDFNTVTGESTWRFLKLRLARIYPAHLTVALLWLPLIGAAWLTHRSISAGVAQSFNSRTFLYALTLTNGWGLPASQGWNLPSWSVGSEWFAYLTFPLLCLGLRRVVTVRGMLAIAATTMLITTGLALIINGGRQYMLPESFTLLRVDSEFLIGCCAYGIYRRWPQGLGARWLSWTGILGCLALASSGWHGLLDGLFIPLFFLVILGFAITSTLPARILALPWVVHLGKISYSIYLIHALIIVILRQILPSRVGLGGGLQLLLGAAYFALVIAAGHFLYSTVEEPSRTYLRRVWIQRARAAVSAQT